MTAEQSYEQYVARVLDAINALEEVLLDPELGNNRGQRKALMSALTWLEMEFACLDCIEGRCHWDGETARRSVAAAEAGEQYVDPTYGRCGCDRHAASVAARARHAAIEVARRGSEEMARDREPSPADGHRPAKRDMDQHWLAALSQGSDDYIRGMEADGGHQ